MKLKLLVTSVWLVLFLSVYAGNGHQLIFCGSTHYDLYHLPEKESYTLRQYHTAAEGGGVTGDTLHTQLKRGVVTFTVFGAQLKPVNISGINDCDIIPVKAENPMLVLDKVTGLSDVQASPLPFQQGSLMLANT